MPHDKAFQKAQKKKLLSALNGFDISAAKDCFWSVGEYTKIHGGRTSAMEGYCIGTMKGSDVGYYAAICPCVHTRLIPPPIVRCSWEVEPTLDGIIAGLIEVRFFLLVRSSYSLVYISSTSGS